MHELHIPLEKEPVDSICIDTMLQNRQALVFCSSKRNAESQAEKITKIVAKKEQLSRLDEQWSILANEIEHTLQQPTKQCKRLALCVRQGIAFHHAGLNSKQRELIEDAFREGIIKIICSTPTLAAGLDLPAFRAIIKDVKRFGQRGMTYIQVLEYLQMAGRAGRPGQETYGEAILIAQDTTQAEELEERFIFGTVEDIYSKLAVEPVLRTYILSLIATEIISTVEELREFFSETFYAQQYGNTYRLFSSLDKIIAQLKEWSFLVTTTDEQKNETEEQKMQPAFITADAYFSKQKQNNNTDAQLSATHLGERISQMYIDPLTAKILLDGLKKLQTNNTNIQDEMQTFSLLHLISCSLEMRPLLRSKVQDSERITQIIEEYSFLLDEEHYYLQLPEEFEDTVKTSLCLQDWINECTEDTLLERYDIRPGELSAKLQKADWLLYACEELARTEKMHNIIKIIRHIRTRTTQGVKSELVPLLQFKGIARVRARQLFSKQVKTISDVKAIQFNQLAAIIGLKLAQQLKEQVGEQVSFDELTFAEQEHKLQLNNKKKEHNIILEKNTIKKHKQQKTLGDF